MNLEIRAFANGGDISKERIVLKALTNLDVGKYALLRSGIGSSGDTPTSGKKMAYWFPDEKVSAGDSVILYTKTGARSKKKLESGQTAYFFYWGREEAIWGDQQSGAVLLAVSDWQFRTPE